MERGAELSAAETLIGRIAGPVQGQPAFGGAATGGGVLLVEGQAGLGKTALLARIRELARSAGVTVLAARGDLSYQDSPWFVTAQLFQRELLAHTPAELGELVGEHGEILARAVGLGVRGDVSGPPGASGASSRQSGHGPDPRDVADGLSRLAVRLSRLRGPLLLTVDDAHWADRSSYGWISTFASQVEMLPVAIVMACRPEELPRRFPSAISAVAAAASHRLRPLSAGGVAELVRHALGDGAQEPFCERAGELTGGIPLVLVDVLSRARAQDVTPTGAGLPALTALASRTLAAHLLAQLGRLGPATTELARAVAILSSRATLDLAARVAGLNRLQAEEAADRLRAALVLRPDGPGDPPTFPHPLYADAVLRSLPRPDHIRLRLAAARLLLDHGHGCLDAAAHLLSLPPRGEGWAAGILLAAGRLSLATGSPAEAAVFLDRARREPPPPDAAAEVLHSLGLATLVRDPQQAIFHLSAALAQPGLRPGLRETVALRLAKSLAHDDRMADAVRLLDVEARTAATHQARLRLRAEHMLWAMFWMDDDDAHARSRRLARLVRGMSGRTVTEQSLLGLRAWDAMLRGEPADTVLGLAAAALGTGMSWVDEDWGFEIPVLVALCHLYCDRPERALELHATGLAELKKQGWHGTHLAFGYALHGQIHYRTGRLVDAESAARRALRCADSLAPRSPARWFALGTLLQALVAQGKIESAEQVTAAHSYGGPFPEAVTIPLPQLVRAELSLAQGRTVEADDVLTDLGRRLDARGAVNPAWCPWLGLLAQARRHTDPARARELADQAVSQARRTGVASAIGQTLCAAGTVTGGSAGLALLAESVRSLEASPARYEHALALTEYGDALRRAARKREAREVLHQAVDLAASCGAQALADQAAERLAMAGGRPRRPRGSGVAALTDRELQIARCAASGQTNAAIARHLHVTPSAVEKALTGIYRKLGVAGRGDLPGHFR
ncbi:MULTISPECIES: AAA family ATPase [unclassified Frankia]